MKEIDVYARNGFKLFPIKANSKEPACRWTEADYTPDQIEEQLLKGMNYGAVIPDDVVVIDVDKHGEDGFNTFSLVSHKFNSTLKVLTASGGLHVFYRVRNKYDRTIGLYPGIDLLTNGYVVGAISNIDGKEYQMINADDIAYANDAVLDFIKAAEMGRKKQKKETVQTVTAQSEVICQSQRNDTLFRKACELSNLDLSEKAVLEAVWKENEEKCQPPLSRNEVMTLVSSALSYRKDAPEKTKQLTDEEIEMLKNSRQSENEIFVYDNEYFSNEYKDLPRLVRLSEIEPKEVEWVVPGYIPKGAITLFASDGGVGKGFTWVNVLASLSSGEKVFFEKEKVNRKCMRVAYFSTEDSTAHVIRPRVDKTGKVVISNILTFDMSSEDIKKVQFDSKDLERLIKREKLDLILYDPVQSFIPENVNMSQRNHMRRLLAPLLQLGEKYGCSFLLVCHTNKRQNAYGRERLADSADLWDISRSVIMLGSLPDGTKYLSHEKSNYGPLQQTVLFDIVDRVPSVIEYTEDRDRDFMLLKNQFRTEKLNEKKQKSMDLYKDLVVSALERSATRSIPSELLDEQMKSEGVSPSNLKKAKASLSKEGRIKYDKRKEDGKERVYTILIDEDVDF